jgi:hypothetical protein
MSEGLHIVFLAYRPWAMPILDSIRRHPNVGHVELCGDDDAYCGYLYELMGTENEPDLVLYCGWSNEPKEIWVNRVPHIGLHCAASDRYSAGTPLQNQIIDGLQETKHRVFRVGFPELSLRQWSHETTLDLRGNVDDILDHLTATGKLLYNQFLDDWPNIHWHRWPQVNEDNWVPKRTPGDSGLTLDAAKKMTTEDLYNFFRCLESPYPNGYVEDRHGRLYIERVRYEKK